MEAGCEGPVSVSVQWQPTIPTFPSTGHSRGGGGGEGTREGGDALASVGLALGCLEMSCTAFWPHITSPFGA